MSNSLAIAYAMKKRKKKMADGGEVEKSDAQASPSPAPMTGAEDMQAAMRKAFRPGKKYAEGGDVKNEDFAEKLKKGMGNVFANGGFVEDEKKSGYLAMPKNMVVANEPADEEEDKNLNQHIVNPLDSYEDEMVARIMHKRSKSMQNVARLSEGGMIANADHGVNDEDLAGFCENEFDDLALRDDLEFCYDGENSGDKLGNAQEDKDREDIVSRIMASRKKKDRLPNPR